MIKKNPKHPKALMKTLTHARAHTQMIHKYITAPNMFVKIPILILGSYDFTKNVSILHRIFAREGSYEVVCHMSIHSHH